MLMSMATMALRSLIQVRLDAISPYFEMGYGSVLHQSSSNEYDRVKEKAKKQVVVHASCPNL
jgi:hypothetical protein